MDNSYGSHNIKYHFVWVTKYRYKMLKGDIAARLRELVRQTCEAFEIRILEGVVSQDHVHILVSAPPTLAPSEITRRIKGRSAAKLLGVSKTEETLLGATLLGEGVLLLNGGAGD